MAKNPAEEERAKETEKRRIVNHQVEKSEEGATEPRRRSDKIDEVKTLKLPRSRRS